MEKDLFNIIMKLHPNTHLYARPDGSKNTDIVVVDNAIHIHAVNSGANLPNITAFYATFEKLPKYLPIKDTKVLKNADGSWYMAVELYEGEVIDVVVSELVGIDDGFGGSNGVEDEVYTGKAIRVKRKVYESDKTATYTKLIDYAIYLPIDVKRNYKVKGYLSLEMDKNVVYCAEKLR